MEIIRKYVAENGREFNSEEDCLKYEAQCKEINLKFDINLDMLSEELKKMIYNKTVGKLVDNINEGEIKKKYRDFNLYNLEMQIADRDKDATIYICQARCSCESCSPVLVCFKFEVNH